MGHVIPAGRLFPANSFGGARWDHVAFTGSEGVLPGLLRALKTSLSVVLPALSTSLSVSDVAL